MRRQKGKKIEYSILSVLMVLQLFIFLMEPFRITPMAGEICMFIMPGSMD